MITLIIDTTFSIEEITSQLPKHPAGYTLIDFSGHQHHVQQLQHALQAQHIPCTIRDFQQQTYQNLESLKARYGAWIASVAKTSCYPHTLLDTFTDGPVSLWWATRLSEKNHLKSPQVFDCLKLMQLSQSLDENTTVICASKRLELIQCIKTLCQRKNISFTSILKPNYPLKQRIKHNIQRSFLATLLCHIPLKIITSTHLSTPTCLANESVMSYYPNYDTDAFKKGAFKSLYWGELHDHFPKHANQLLYFNPAAKSSKRTFKAHLNTFQTTHNNSLSSLLPSLTLRRWIRLIQRFITLRIKLRHCDSPDVFDLPEYHLNLYPLHQKEWASTLRGSHLFALLWTSASLKQRLETLPLQHRFFYIMEMQGWETLLNQWIRHMWPNCTRIGVTHVPIRSAHIQYFRDDSEHTLYPYPTHIGVCSPLNHAPFKQLVSTSCMPIEALRFSHLNTLRLTTRSHVLVTTSFDTTETHDMLRILNEYCTQQPPQLPILIKEHPLSPITASLAMYPALSPSMLTTQTLTQLLPHTHLIFSANNSAVSLESSHMGIPTCSTENLATLSMCTGLSGIQIISSGSDLNAAIHAATRPAQTDAFFYLDPEFKKGKALLASTTPKNATHQNETHKT